MSGAASGSAWGDEKTRFFFELTPDRVLDAGGSLVLERCGNLHGAPQGRTVPGRAAARGPDLRVDPARARGNPRRRAR